MKIDRKLQFALLAFIGSLAMHAQRTSAAEPLTPEQLNQAVKRLTVSKNNVAQTPELLPRIHKTTWQLLVGEMASDSSFTLPSGAHDELAQGLKELDELILELKDNPRLERELTQHLQLTMRFDATRARRPTIDKQREISRQEELDRLSQLREINRTYRDLIGDLMQWQAAFVMHHTDHAIDLGETAAKLFSDIERIVGRRRDYYLFEDEPGLTAAPSEELKLVRELAQPLAHDVRRHQLAMQAYTLVQLAMPTTENSRERLAQAKKLAEAAVLDADHPPKLGYWALALACREIGRLETLANPWDEAAHQRATPWLQLAQKNLESAEHRAEANLNWNPQIHEQLTELAAPATSMQNAVANLKRGEPRVAASLLEQCATLHRSPQVALQLSDCRRYSGNSLEELDRLFEVFISARLLSETDAGARFARGRQGVLGIWRQLTHQPPNPLADHKQTLQTRLQQALSDLEFAGSADNKAIRQMADLYLALASVIGFVLDPQANPDQAQSRMRKTPAVLAELNQARPELVGIDQLQVDEASLAGKLAYGYLTLRFISDYRDVSQKAFASIEDSRAAITPGLTMPQPIGSVALQSLLARPDNVNARLARDEQLVRRSLQQAFPTLAVLQLAPHRSTATNLQATVRGLDANRNDEFKLTELDPQETLDAKASASRDLSNATILAFLTTHDPASALREALYSFPANTQTSDLKNLDLAAFRQFWTKEGDPVRLAIVALALEEFATSGLLDSEQSIAEMLGLALQLQRAAQNQFDESVILKRAHPSEMELNSQAVRRLTEPKFYLQQSQELMSEFRLSEARKLLEAGIRRHPASMELREAYVQTLIDEADLRPQHTKELVTLAIEQLEKLTANQPQPVLSSVLKLAELYERTGNDQGALELYRQIVEHSKNNRESLIARSRLTTLQVRFAKR